MDGVDIHGIWINLGALVSRDVVLLNGVGVVGLFVGNGISSFPLGLKVDCVSVPIINFSGDGIHSIDLFHE